MPHMKRIPNDYIERCYAGWLAKLIGIRYGAPIEGWTYDQIREVYGELDGYLVDYRSFAADDDSNGPIFFIRALNDYTSTRELTPQQIALGWLNYAPYEHGFYWWGGYGNSTEHTAYLNLRAGIPAPRSGSIAQNGATVAEQIGGQIFIDTWGLVLPNQPVLAAEYAGKAASVSHDGNGIYGAQFIAAAISLAFTADGIRTVLNRALEYIPADCDYARAVRDVMAFHDAQRPRDWRAAFEHVRRHWGYHRYPGNCHIIPNSAAMVLAMLYGNGDFDRTLNICNMCGWDTDCNVGNVATIMGVLCGLDCIDYRKWRMPINDFFAASSVLGCLNQVDVPWCVAYLADLAYRMAGEELPVRWLPYIKPGERYYHFRFPCSTHGFTVEAEHNGQIEAQWSNSGGKEPALKVSVLKLLPAEAFRIKKRTYYRPADFHDNRYDPAFSPILYPGQAISLRIRQAKSCSQELYAALYVKDGNSKKIVEGEKFQIPNDQWLDLSFNIPSLPHTCLEEMGVRVIAGGDRGYGKREAVLVYVSEVRITEKPAYDIDFSYERMELYSNLHREVSQFTYLKGVWTLENGWMSGHTQDYGEAYTGDLSWNNYRLTCDVNCVCDGPVSLLVRVQGAIRSYAVTLSAGQLMIQKNENGYHTLAACNHETVLNKIYRLSVDVRDATLCVIEGEKELLRYTDTENPYLNGCIGLGVYQGARALFNHLLIER